MSLCRALEKEKGQASIPGQSATISSLWAEQAIDRDYWQPVRRELEAMRLEEARRKRQP
jgi:hypothetical protein